jgi:hypothetical protein
VKKDSDACTSWIFRRQNNDEKYAPQNVQGKMRDSGVYQMVWGCFVGDKLGPLVCIDDRITQDIYIELLRQNLAPFIDSLTEDSITNLTFQQDNAPPHTAYRTKSFLSELSVQHRFNLMEWPAHSPDLNPIENLWAHLKTQLNQRYPDTKYIRGNPDSVRRVLNRD